MATTTACSQNQTECIEEVYQRIASDLSMITDRQLVVESIETECMDQRPAGQGAVHISFRLGFVDGENEGHGCVLVPLPEAISLACCLMMVSPDVIEKSRRQMTLDSTTKDAMLEVGNFICGATETALHALGINAVTVRFEGCQGVKPDVRPALIYSEGERLVVGRAQAALEGFEPDTMLLIFPECAFGAQNAG